MSLCPTGGRSRQDSSVRSMLFFPAFRHVVEQEFVEALCFGIRGAAACLRHDDVARELGFLQMDKAAGLRVEVAPAVVGPKPHTKPEANHLLHDERIVAFEGDMRGEGSARAEGVAHLAKAARPRERDDRSFAKSASEAVSPSALLAGTAMPMRSEKGVFSMAFSTVLEPRGVIVVTMTSRCRSRSSCVISNETCGLSSL